MKLNATGILKKKIDEVVKHYGIKTAQYTIETPDPRFGDVSANLAMVGYPLVKDTFQSPRAFAEDIVKVLRKDSELATHFDRIEVDGPGFINVWFSSDYLLNRLSEIIGKKETYGTSESHKGKKIMVEFAHPNTHKAFHIGHLRNISIGESIVRLLEATGYKVIRANYQGDVGMHIAKAIYAVLYIQPFKDEVNTVKGVHERVEFLGKAYAVGSSAFENNEDAKETIQDINYLVYASAQRFQEHKGERVGSTDYTKFVKGRMAEVDKVFELWEKSRQWSLDYFETMYKRVYTHYDRYYFESECLDGVDLAKEAVKKGILEESDGAIIFNGKPYGLHTRVFVNSLGLPTYEAKELSLAEKEFSEFGKLDKIIHVVGPEQASFFKVTFKVEELLHSDTYNDTQKHLMYGWVRLKQGKMSSRSGNVVLGEWLLDEAKSRIKTQFKEMDSETAEQVAVGAVKYSMLKVSTASDISFSFDESISLEGNSGPYLQYTYVRTQSVLKKSKINPSASLRARDQRSRSGPEALQDRMVKTSSKFKVKSSELNTEELMLLRTLVHFENVVEKAAEQFAPNLLCTYLFDLSQKFNLFYQKHPVLRSEMKEFRLSLTASVGQVLENGLHLLGIQVAEKM